MRMKILEYKGNVPKRRRTGVVVVTAILVLSCCSILNNDFVFEYKEMFSKNHIRSRRMVGEGSGCDIKPAHRPVGNETRPIFTASYPGSGAKMLWNIIEGLTELWTGDEWFQNGRNLPNEVVSVKTHYPQSNGREVPWKDQIDRAVLLLRSPLHAIPSYHNYIYEYENKLPPHSTRAPTEVWIEWRDKHFEKELAAWENHVRYWVDTFGVADDNKLLIITYENLISGPEEIEEISNFLKPVPSINSPECIYEKVVHYKDKKVLPKNIESISNQQTPSLKETPVAEQQEQESLTNDSALSDENQHSNLSEQEPDLFSDSVGMEGEETADENTGPDLFSDPAQEEASSEGSQQTKEEEPEGNSISKSSANEEVLPFNEEQQGPQIISAAPISNEVPTPNLNFNELHEGTSLGDLVSQSEGLPTETLYTTQENGLDIAHRVVDPVDGEKLQQTSVTSQEGAIDLSIPSNEPYDDSSTNDSEKELEDGQKSSVYLDSMQDTTQQQEWNDFPLKINGEAVTSTDNGGRLMKKSPSNGMMTDSTQTEVGAMNSLNSNEGRVVTASPPNGYEMKDVSTQNQAGTINQVDSNEVRTWSIPPPTGTEMKSDLVPMVVRRTRATMHERMMEERHSRKLQELVKEEDNGLHWHGIGGTMVQHYIQQEKARTLEEANVASQPYSLRTGPLIKPYTTRELGLVLNSLRSLHHSYRNNSRLVSILFDYVDEVLSTVPDERRVGSPQS